MRAIAIILVVAAHARIPFLSAGFIGVDIFFVLSGYLISGLLVSELSASGRIDFARFYFRRVKRLAPALLTMVVLTSIAAIFLLSPIEQHAQLDGARYAVVWVSNIFFAFSDYGYFEAGSESNLFLHTWSLGVEEQFYLVWPLLLFALVRIGYGGSTTDASFRVSRGLVIVVVAGMAASILLTFVKVEWAFYLMPSRAWQFATGGLVYLYTSQKQVTENGPCGFASHRYFGLAGAGCILASILVIDGGGYPGIWALLPTVGTALLLLGGGDERNKAESIYRLLVSPPLRWFGNISYSWYLWHWPVLVLGFTILDDPGVIDVSMLVLVSIAIATLTYYLVEAPIRYRVRIGSGMVPTFAVFFAVTGLCLWLTSGWGNFALASARSDEQSRYTLAKLDVAKIYRDGCDDWYFSSRLSICRYGNSESARTVVVLGDSIGVQWFPAVERLFGDLGWEIVVLTKSSCPIIDKPIYYAKIGRYYTECAVWRTKALDWIRKSRPDIVFIGNNQASFGQQGWVEGTSRILEGIAEQVPAIFIIQPTHTIGFDGPACQARYQWQKRYFEPIGNCAEKISDSRNTDIKTWLTSATNRFGNVRLIDLNDVVCPGQVCVAERGSQVIFSDKQHITASFSASVSGELGKQIFADSR